MAAAGAAKGRRDAAVGSARLQQSDPLVYLDTLRGIAILLVIWFHHALNFGAYPLLRAASNYGVLGVPLFFFVSAYTLCRSAEKRRHEPGATSSYFIRRFFRVAPLYYCGILLYGLLSVLQIDRAGGVRFRDDWTLGNLLANLTFTHGFVPGAQNAIVPGGWSIGAEMGFYACFPLLLPVYRRLHARHWALAALGMPMAALALNCAIVLAAYLHGHPIRLHGPLYFALSNHPAVYLFGMAGYFLIRANRLRERPMRDVAAFVLLTALCAAMLAGRWYWTALLPTVAAASFLFLTLFVRRYRVQAGSIERIGQHSYSMYLLHFLFVGAFTKRIAGTLTDVGTPVILVYLGTLALVVGLTYLLSRVTKPLIEDSMIRLGAHVIRARNVRLRAPEMAGGTAVVPATEIGGDKPLPDR